MNRKTKMLGEIMPKDNLNKTQGFVAELKAKIEKKTQEQQRQATIPANRQKSDSLVYADLKLNPAQRPFKEKLIEDVEYAEVSVDSRFILQADELKHKLQSNFEEIEKLETKIKKGFTNGLDPNTLNETKTELRNANVLKHELQSQLQEIREPLNNEFANNYKHAQNKVADLEERIKYEHGGKYTQLTSELFQTQNAHISLIQKHIEFEEKIANSSKDDLKATAEAHIHDLHKEELGLQHKRLALLGEKKNTIGQNAANHRGTPKFEVYQKEFDKSMGEIKDCTESASILENKIATRKKTLQSEEGALSTKDRLDIRFSFCEDNPLYEKEVAIEEEQKAPAVDRTKKPSRLNQSNLFLPSSARSENEDAKEEEKISRKAFASRQ